MRAIAKVCGRIGRRIALPVSKWTGAHVRRLFPSPIPAQAIVVWRSGENRPEPSGSAAVDPLRRQAEQIVRFSRPNILFYDEHVIGLTHRIFALYRWCEDTERKEKSDRHG